MKRISRCFTLFFIPVIKYDHRHFIRCPICNFEKEITEDDFSGVMDGSVNVSYNPYPDLSFSTPVFKGKVDLLENNLAVCSFCKDEVKLTPAETDSGVFFCPSCRKKNITDDKTEYVAIHSGGNTAVCGKCSREIELEKEELAQKSFTCPKCNALNKIEEEIFFSNKKGESEAVCGKCRTPKYLDYNENKSASFICPECGAQNKITISQK
jgi:predicted RNA-binding Zn-ribbon protein involved in translation (DUF1610 family)